MKDDVPPFERHLLRVRQIGLQRPQAPDHGAYERFMGEFHRDYPDATADQYVRFKHVAASASGMLVAYGEKNSDAIGCDGSQMKKPGGNRALTERNEAMRSLFAKVEKVNDEQRRTTEYVIESLLARSVDGVVTMHRGIAGRILEEMNFEGQRKIKHRRLIKHVERIRNGAWRSSFPITIVRLPNGKMWLVDGQHRLSAIVECDAAAEIRVHVVDVPNEDEARRMYAGFDEHDSSRNHGELLDAAGIPSATGLKRETVRKLFLALPLLRNDMEPVRGGGGAAMKPHAHSVDGRLQDILSWKDEAVEYERIIEAADHALRRKLVQAGCMAVALYTLRHQPQRAREFWNGVAQNDGLRKYDPRARLIADMQARQLNKGSARQSVLQPASAWNAWNEGRELRIIKVLDNTPITLWGTPLAKGRRK